MSKRSVEGEKPEEFHFYQSADLETLLRDPGPFSYGIAGKGIRTEGVYKVLNRRVSSGLIRSYGYDGFGASYRSSLYFFVDETGRLSSTSDSLALRVHRYYGLGPLKYRADEIEGEPLGLAKQVIVSGFIAQRFRKGYFLEVYSFEEIMPRFKV